jgi:hypothetical protein
MATSPSSDAVDAKRPFLISDRVGSNKPVIGNLIIATHAPPLHAAVPLVARSGIATPITAQLFELTQPECLQRRWVERISARLQCSKLGLPFSNKGLH